MSAVLVLLMLPAVATFALARLWVWRKPPTRDTLTAAHAGWRTGMVLRVKGARFCVGEHTRDTATLLRVLP